MNKATHKKWLRPLLTVALCVAALGWAVSSYKEITSDRIVAHATMPNGVEIKVRQTFSWDGDLFNTAFYYRRPGGEWVWRYYSHEDWYWRHGRVELDEPARTATIYRDGKPTINFHWETLAHTQFTVTQDGSPKTFTTEYDR